MVVGTAPGLARRWSGSIDGGWDDPDVRRASCRQMLYVCLVATVMVMVITFAFYAFFAREAHSLPRQSIQVNQLAL